MLRVVVVSTGVVLGGCTAPPVEAIDGTSVAFAPEEVPRDFFAAPFPLDETLHEGGPDFRGLPNLGVQPLVDDLVPVAAQLRGHSVMPVASFRFDAPISTWEPDDVQPAEPSSPVLLLALSSRGPTLLPTVAHTLAPDDWVPSHVLGVAPVPGFILEPGVVHAFVVRRDAHDAAGDLLGAPLAVRRRLVGEEGVPDWTDVADGLEQLGVALDDVAAVARFTPGDAVAETFAMSEVVRARFDPVLEDLAVAPPRDEPLPGYCELRGRLTVPMFQRGTPPYDLDGQFEVDAEGALVVQREEAIPVVVTVPHGPMPEAGYPIGLYFHGSGGRADQLVARGPAPQGGSAREGYGPAWVLARSGIAGAGSAHPLSPDRVPGASSFAYLNFNNFAVFPFTFRQGTFEQRLYLDALLDLELSPELLADCEGGPVRTAPVRFDPASVVAMGQSMGGMYTNLVGAVEPRIRAVVPTGAGGHWSRFILVTELLGDGTAAGLLRLLVGSDSLDSFLHPVLHLAQTAWEPAEPVLATPRLARRPLEGHPVRPIYQPVGLGDSYFPPVTFDTIALAYGTERAGEEVWPSMDDALALDGRAPLPAYPVTDNAVSEDGTPFTAVVVQSAGDGFSDPHTIFTQLPEIRFQYGCFFESFLATGRATVAAPGDEDAGCP